MSSWSTATPASSRWWIRRPRASSATIKVGDALEFPAVDGKGRAFVNVESTGEIAVIDLAKRQVLGRYAMADCKRPTGLAYVVGNRLVSSCGSGVAKILDADTGKEIASLKIGGFPDAVLYDPNRALALIPTALDGQLNVIALSGAGDNTIVATIPTQIGTRTGAVDPVDRPRLPADRRVHSPRPGRPAPHHQARHLPDPGHGPAVAHATNFNRHGPTCSGHP